VKEVSHFLKRVCLVLQQDVLIASLIEEGKIMEVEKRKYTGVPLAPDQRQDSGSWIREFCAFLYAEKGGGSSATSTESISGAKAVREFIAPKPARKSVVRAPPQANCAPPAAPPPPTPPMPAVLPPELLRKNSQNGVGYEDIGMGVAPNEEMIPMSNPMAQKLVHSRHANAKKQTTDGGGHWA
jgi:hypothetical protein